VLAHYLNGVHTKLNFWLDFAVGSVATALHEVSRNGRVMANLLDLDRAAIDPTLENLPSKGLKGFYILIPMTPTVTR
jgi:hypothetical protein